MVAVAFESLLLAVVVRGRLPFARGRGFLSGGLFGFWSGRRRRNGFGDGNGGGTITPFLWLGAALVLGRRIHFP
jgi:hypothetical protein